mmetsp:Transcript_127557/g.408278  ORF Transcript_127557/g.408278 Transcript_127557/m.408278 type:complete len:204 (-) Transcript_127557:40-651(-)
MPCTQNICPGSRPRKPKCQEEQTKHVAPHEHVSIAKGGQPIEEVGQTEKQHEHNVLLTIHPALAPQEQVEHNVGQHRRHEGGEASGRRTAIGGAPGVDLEVDERVQAAVLVGPRLGARRPPGAAALGKGGRRAEVGGGQGAPEGGSGRLEHSGKCGPEPPRISHRRNGHGNNKQTNFDDRVPSCCGHHCPASRSTSTAHSGPN